MRFPVTCIALLLLLVPDLAPADRLDRLELDIWRIRSEVHMLTVMEGAREYRQGLSEALDRAELARRELEADEDSKAQELYARIGEDWRALEQAGRSIVRGGNGAASAHDVEDVEHYVAESTAGLQAFREEEGATGLWQLGRIMQQLTAHYMALAADMDAEPADLHEQVMAFESTLDQLRSELSGDSGLERSLDEIESRWRFIRGSVINARDGSVPYLVYRYNREIRERVEAFEEGQ